MWLLPYAHILTLAIGGSEVQPPGNMALPQPIFSRQAYFSIPFQVDQPGQHSGQAAAVQLHVSTDRGKTWLQHASVPPTAAHFLFRAPGEGEYWFGVRTLDRSNHLRPAKIDGPGLIVIVDTSPPKLALQAEHGRSGLVTARWQVAERRLDRNSLTILYRSGPNLPWLRVATQRQEDDFGQSAWSDSVSWMPVSGPGPLEVRAEIADTAGNRDISYAQVAFDEDHGTSSGSASLVPLAPGTDEPDRGQSGFQSGPDTSRVDARYTDGPSAAARQSPVSTFGDESTSKGSSNGWHAVAGEPRPDTYRADGARDGQGDYSMPGSVAAGTSAPNLSIAARSNPAISNNFDRFGETEAPIVHPHDLLSRPNSRTVNSSSFEVGYDLDIPVQASPVRVEIWGTRDGGRTWLSYGVDKDARSPILVTVEGEGTYGFSILVSDSRNPIGKPPRPQAPPEVLVTVDLTDPVARILSAQRAAYDSDGRISVRWDAGDARLAQRPISLYYASYQGGAWKPVAIDLPNNGQYEWLPPRNLPDRIHLRLEVRDAAGNIGVSQTAKPIVLTD